ncbi:tetratricopeptide repeat protein [Asticcacaulis sp. YBE204]|uniref:tetratricopeptide repeat-containing glycosyltransferase family protein n=1 Tax=Asticcacaulis sp. YBE204 TaxID=1282363 RepID=UPI0003C3F3B8|nr:tetratricopeptide repeat-containing glycosyltransferase family protein [Asticcacaulis sp. YBE204]ESQ80437.1 hypothetical protein AEYBE204_04000 [Asticcacaulis sp. YBE204]
MPKKTWSVKTGQKPASIPFDLPEDIARHLSPPASDAPAVVFDPAKIKAAGDAALPAPIGNPEDQSIILGDSLSNEALRVLLETTAHIKQLELLNRLKDALVYLQDSEFKAAGDAALKALDVDEKCATAWHILAISREKSGDLSGAFSCYEAAMRLEPENIGIANDIGRLAFFMGLHENAEQFYRYVLKREPFHPEATNNYASSLREMSRLEEAIDILRPALEQTPGNAALWNTLGTILNAQGDLDTALIFFDEALKYDKVNGKIWHNRGLILGNLGRVDEAIESLDEALKLFEDPNHVEAAQLAQAFNYFLKSDLKHGWTYYEARKQTHGHDGMKYLTDIPQLDVMADLRGQSVFISTEQGLGDEILFSTLLPDLLEELGPDGKLTLAVEKRLVSLFQRSYPQAHVTPHLTAKHSTYQVRFYPEITDPAPYSGFAVLGDFLPKYRPTVADFPKLGAFLSPDPDRVAYWKGELDKLGPFPKIGLLWKSLVKHSRRDRYYSPFESWKPILRTPGLIFINLQYGDASAELAEAAREGLTIWNPPGIDLKQDLDDLSALCAAVDLVLGPSNATSNIAAAVGTPIWLLTPPSSWPMLGTDYYPWYAVARMFVNPDLSDWTPALTAMHEALITEIAAPVVTPPAADIARAFQQVQRALLMRDWDDAEAQARILTQVAPTHSGAWQALATALDRLNRLPEALDAYQRALGLEPDSLDIAADLAQLAFRIGQYDKAERFYAHVIARDPTHLTAVNYYAAALREQSKYDVAIATLQTYLGEYPKQSELWDTLGTILMAQGDLDTALIFFNEAVNLDNSLAARFNRACAWMEQGLAEQALPDIEVCLDRFSEPSNLRSAELTLAYAYLALGRVAEGWKAYEARHMQGTPQAVAYDLDLPRHETKSTIDEKCLLIIAEQGLGDEIMFATLLPDVVRDLGKGHVTLAVEPRLVPLFKRAAPKATVLAHHTRFEDGLRHRSVPELDTSTIDEWALLGDFLPVYRNDVAAFAASGPILSPDPARIAYWREEVAKLGNGPKVGLLWKSLKNDSRRARFYSALDQWTPILSQSGPVFVNLQYGDVETELAEAKAAGYHIYNPPIDLMNDLDELSALCAALDLIIGPSNATTQIAAATGAAVWMLLPTGTWTTLGTEHYPWYPKVRLFQPHNNDWAALLSHVAISLNEFNAPYRG